MSVSQEKIDQYNKDGYVVLEGFLPSEHAEKMREGIRGRILEKLEERAKEASAKTFPQQLKDSMAGIEYFFHEGALVDGKVAGDPRKAVSLIGFGLHKSGDLGSKFIHGDHLKAAVKSVTGFKSAKIAFSAAYNLHTDFIQDGRYQMEEFLQTNPAGNGVQVLYFVTDSNKDAGHFKVIPGSHKTVTSTRKAKVNPQATSGKDAFKYEGSAPFEDGSMDGQMVDLVVPAGSLVLINSLTLAMFVRPTKEGRPCSVVEVPIFEESAHVRTEYSQPEYVSLY